MSLPTSAETYRRLTGVDPLVSGKKVGNEYAVPCVNSAAHSRGDKSPSLHISAGEKGWTCRVCGEGGGAIALVKFAGKASTDAQALEWLGVERDEEPSVARRAVQRSIVARYAYRDLDGTVRYEVLRYEPKDFRQRRIVNGSEVWNLDGVKRVPYRLPEIVKAITEKRSIVVVEGEKDADNLATLGFCATTNAGGAAWTWTSDFIAPMQGAKRIIVVADNDDAGRTAANKRAQLLRGICGDVRLIEHLPTQPKGDLSDLIAAGWDAAKLRELFESAVPVRAGVERLSEVVLRQKLAPPPPPAIPTGFAALDCTIGGLRQRQTTVIGARPGVGKSAFAEQLAAHIAQNFRVLYCSLEMGTDRSVDRLVARLHGYHESQYLRMLRPVKPESVEHLDLHFCEYTVFTDIADAVLEHRPDVVIIDHSRELDGWFKVERGSRVDVSAAVLMGQIVQLGKSSGAHMVVLSQCSRSADNKRPDLSSLRDSGAVEEKADTVLFLHRPFQFSPSESDNICEIVGWKARGYGAFIGHMRWVGELMFFDEPQENERAYIQRCCPQTKDAKTLGVSHVA